MKAPQIGFGENEILIEATTCIKELKEIDEQEELIKDESVKIETLLQPTSEGSIPRLELDIRIPQGKVSQIMGLLHYIQTKFNKVKIKVDATEEGSVTKEEYENKIREALKQLGIT